jgi:small multidrug resistance family-3 protein
VRSEKAHRRVKEQMKGEEEHMGIVSDDHNYNHLSISQDNLSVLSNGETNSTSSHDNGHSVEWKISVILFSLALFIIAGLFEIAGGYLVWIGIREKKNPYLFIPLGCLILIGYGFIPTFQPMDSFGRIFAVYGGFFIVLSYLWAYIFDNMKLDAGDYIGSAVALAGVCLCWFWPR